MKENQKILPEEKVRIQLLSFMKKRLLYPAEKISVERSLSSLPHLKGKKVPNRRFDILVFGRKKVEPLLVVECKAVKLDQSAMDQIIGYNYLIQAPFLALANQSGVVFLEKKGNAYIKSEGMAPYEILLEQVEGNNAF